MCNDPITPDQPFFYDCKYQFDGAKSDGELYVSEWYTAGRLKFMRLPDSHSPTNWDRMVITTQPITECDTECSICMCDIDESHEYTTVCKHTFHSYCIKQWSNISIGRGVTCPLCRTSLTDQMNKITI